MDFEVFYCGDYGRITQCRLPGAPAGLVIARTESRMFMFRVTILAQFQCLSTAEQISALLVNVPVKHHSAFNNVQLDFLQGATHDTNNIAHIRLS